MSEAAKFWDVRSEDDHQLMAALLAPMIVASRDKNFIDPKAARAQTYAWRLALVNVPKGVVKEAIDRLVARGINWMPRPGEVKQECAKLGEQRRALVRQSALAGCTHPSQWEDTEHGLQRCGCWTVMRKQLESIDQPLELPPAREDALEMQQ